MYKFINFLFLQFVIIFSFLLGLIILTIGLLVKDLIILFFCIVFFTTLAFTIVNHKKIQTNGNDVVMIDLFISKKKTINQSDIIKIKSGPMYLFPFNHIVYYKRGAKNKWFLFYGLIKRN